MKFRHERKDNILYISFSGDILFIETSELSDYLENLLSEEFDEAVLNFKEVSGITSSAIGAVIDFYHKLRVSHKKMRIKGMSEKACSVFRYFKLDQLFPIEK
jgi:anti-anti-sigma factor